MLTLDLTIRFSLDLAIMFTQVLVIMCNHQI
jgi:hypothetical protein